MREARGSATHFPLCQSVKTLMQKIIFRDLSINISFIYTQIL